MSSKLKVFHLELLVALLSVCVQILLLVRRALLLNRIQVDRDHAGLFFPTVRTLGSLLFTISLKFEGLPF